MADFESMSVKQLKEYILSKGGDTVGCIEKIELANRAKSLSKPISSSIVAGVSPTKTPIPPTKPGKPNSTSASINNGSSSSSSSTTASKFNNNNNKSQAKIDEDFVDEDAELSSSDDEEEEEEEENNKKGTKSSQKRFSVFRVKKFMTSKIGNTTAGRATVMKVLGEDGDVVIQALKSVTVKIRDVKIAKANKKDGIRFCLKAYNLWKHKDFTLDNTKLLQNDAQLLAEIFCREVTNVGMGKPSDVIPLTRVALRIHDGCMQLMSPHIQPKNAIRLSELLKFYASVEFYDCILNKTGFEAERDAIDKSTTTLLLPLTPILSGERERSSYARLQSLFRVLENKRFEAVLEHPQVTQIFQQYLDLEVGLAPKNSLRFMLAVRDYEKIASRELLKMRAPKIVEKYLSPSAEFKVDGVNQAAIDFTLENIASGVVGMGTFNSVIDEVKKAMEDDFHTQFVDSQDFIDLRIKIGEEIAKLEKQLNEEGSIASTPINRTRRTFAS